jgi:peptide/nickel transport system substrate-binding protein
VESLNPRFRIDVLEVDIAAMTDGVANRKLLVHVRNDGAPFHDPHAFAFQFMRSTPNNPCKYANEEADQLVGEAVRELDVEKRAELYRRLGRIEHEDAPYLFLYDTPGLRVQRSWVKGYVYNPMLPNGCRFYDMEKRE